MKARLLQASTLALYLPEDRDFVGRSLAVSLLGMERELLWRMFP
jgi:hypothetical protein